MNLQSLLLLLAWLSCWDCQLWKIFPPLCYSTLPRDQGQIFERFTWFFLDDFKNVKKYWYIQSVFSVNVKHFSFSTSLSSWQLSSDAKSVSQLGLSSSEFSKCLCYPLTFNSSLYLFVTYECILQRSMSNCLDPVVIFLIFFLFSMIWRPLTYPILSIFEAAS